MNRKFIIFKNIFIPINPRGRLFFFWIKHSFSPNIFTVFELLEGKILHKERKLQCSWGISLRTHTTLFQLRYNVNNAGTTSFERYSNIVWILSFLGYLVCSFARCSLHVVSTLKQRHQNVRKDMCLLGHTILLPQE